MCWDISKEPKGRLLHLKAGDLKILKMHVDAAFATHPDAKSQTGVAVFLGEALLFAASRKQKCVSKSPTDSELIALSDNIHFAELFAEFLAFIMNRNYTRPLIYEDCTAVISLVTEGGGVVRTKHLSVRMELAKQALQDERIVVKYINTKQMLADGLTKALEGEEFVVFAEQVGVDFITYSYSCWEPCVLSYAACHVNFEKKIKETWRIEE